MFLDLPGSFLIGKTKEKKKKKKKTRGKSILLSSLLATQKKITEL